MAFSGGTFKGLLKTWKMSETLPGSAYDVSKSSGSYLGESEWCTYEVKVSNPGGFTFLPLLPASKCPAGLRPYVTSLQVSNFGGPMIGVSGANLALVDTAGNTICSITTTGLTQNAVFVLPYNGSVSNVTDNYINMQNAPASTGVGVSVVNNGISSIPGTLNVSATFYYGY